jgi:hypothetical protein
MRRREPDGKDGLGLLSGYRIVMNAHEHRFHSSLAAPNERAMHYYPPRFWYRLGGEIIITVLGGQ